MKNLFILFWLALWAVCGNAQVNLVPNPSFESYEIDSCPNALSEISRAIGWYQAMPSCDYFNACSTDTDGLGRIWAGVPSNAFGYRTAASGSAYAGAILHGPANQDREAIGAQLITPLQIGIRYYVSFKASLAGCANPPFIYCGINKLGILFSTVHYNSTSPPPICNCSQIYTDSIITDTLNWTRIKGSFVADSNYSFINVGRFYDNTLTDTMQVSGTFPAAYYFFDDVCVSTDSAYAYNFVYTGIRELSINNCIDFYPNPARDWITIRGNDIRTLTLCDVLGRIVYTTNSDIISPSIINVASLPRGMYFLSAKTKSEIINKKIILN